MKNMNVLVFDIRADFGHFRKIYSTSSPLTYSIIPPTSFFGILGAIIGLGKEENAYLRYVNHETVNMAIRIMSPVRKIRMGLNHVNTKGNIWVPKQRREGARTQIRTEFLRFPHFRCYVHVKEQSLFQQLIDYIQQHRSVYTVCMGLSECIADVQYVSLEEFRLVNNHAEAVSIASVIPEKYVTSLCIESGKEYRKERFAFQINEERIVSDYEEILFEASGEAIRAVVSHYWENKTGERIVFLYDHGKE
jgi:CRISPR-associated protein Cas5h